MGGKGHGQRSDSELAYPKVQTNLLRENHEFHYLHRWPGRHHWRRFVVLRFPLKPRF